MVTRNKARLVAIGHAQIGSIDLEESFASMARLESIQTMSKTCTYFMLPRGVL